MAARFEVIVNGERVCVSGVDDDGVLSVSVDYVQRANEDGDYRLHVGGLARFLPSHDRPQHARWQSPSIGIGDEITIRVLEPGEFDLPQNMIGHPRDSITDPLFGDLDYNVNAWDGDLEITCHPFTKCHVHLWSDSDGPSDSQRHRLKDFLSKHDELWPKIAESLVRCHTEIESIAELTARIRPRIGIDNRPFRPTIDNLHQFLLSNAVVSL